MLIPSVELGTAEKSWEDELAGRQPLYMLFREECQSRTWFPHLRRLAKHGWLCMLGLPDGGTQRTRGAIL